ncbi:MAG: WecB/TagA/CpsF family glycosyltransferase [Acidimicrobiia bacterium]
MSGEARPVLGVLVRPLTMDEAVEEVVRAGHEQRPLGVSALAVHGLMTAVGDPELQYRLNALEMVVADGQPVRWGLNWLHGSRLPERVAGPDLMDQVCRRAAAELLPIYLYGSTQETLDRLAGRLTYRHPGLQVAGAQPSRFRSATPEERVGDLERIRATGARIVLVGLGCPRQEVWVYENRLDLSLPALGVGAAFDFHAGLLERAPVWMQRSGLEWLYRLLQEPGRLWRRYLFLNPAYLSLLALEKLRLRRFDSHRATPPAQPVLPG